MRRYNFDTSNNQGSNQGLEVGFWQRQFAPVMTRGQKDFDVFFGISAPVLCFMYDPAIFRGDFRYNIINIVLSLPRYQIFAYLLSGLCMIALALWLWGNERIRSRSEMLSSVLLTGAVFASVLGIVILPLTLIGLLVIIGVFGFVPFLTGFVFLRNAIRASRYAVTQGKDKQLLAAIVVSACLVTTLPILIQTKFNHEVDEAMHQIVNGESPQQSDVNTLRRVKSFADMDTLVKAYERTQDSHRRERLAIAYKEITGEEIESRWDAMRD